MTSQSVLMKPDPVPKPAPSKGGEPLLLLAFTLLLAIPLFRGRVLFGWDVISYLIMGQQTGANLREGILLPAWASDLNNGFGSPALLLYPPLLNFVHGLLVVLGIPLIVGITLLSVLVWFLSGGILYLWLRRSGAPQPLFGGLFYIGAAYRLYDLYDRGALAEHWCFLWVPLILWFASDARLERFRLPLVSVATAALLLTNLPFGVLFGLLLVAWVLTKRSGGEELIRLGAGLGAGALLASFALVPPALASRWVKVELFYGSDSAAFRPSANVLFSANTLWITSMVLVTGGILMVALLLQWKDGRGANRFWFWAGLVCLVATLPPAGPLWDVMPILSRIQYPWRMAGPLTLCAAVAVGWLPHWRIAAGLTLCAVAAGLPFVGAMTVPLSAFSRQEPAGIEVVRFPDPAAVREASGVAEFAFDPVLETARVFGPEVRRSTLQRYLLEMWFVPRAAERLTREAMIGRFTGVLLPLRDEPGMLVDAAENPVSVVRRGRLEESAVVEATTKGTFLWRRVAFPGMETTVDGKSVGWVADPATGLVSVEVPAGRHALGWKWRAPLELRAARWLSGSVLLVLLLLSLFGRKKTPPQAVG